ncbi:hypothetical protein [Bacteroides finegoldii]|nr:hypothetical protein [Bacteroides finegoldii]
MAMQLSTFIHLDTGIFFHAWMAVKISNATKMMPKISNTLP